MAELIKQDAYIEKSSSSDSKNINRIEEIKKNDNEEVVEKETEKVEEIKSKYEEINRKSDESIEEDVSDETPDNVVFCNFNLADPLYSIFKSGFYSKILSKSSLCR